MSGICSPTCDEGCHSNAQHVSGNDPIAHELYARLCGVLRALGVSHKTDDIEESTNGYWLPSHRMVVTSRALSGNQELKTLCHEAIHAFCNHRGDVRPADSEIVAEAASFVILNHFGIDTSSYSLPYIAGWAKDRQRVLRNIGEIQRVSNFMIDRIS